MLRHLVHILSIVSLVMALAGMGVPSQGRGCVQIAKAEVCLDPALRVGDGKSDHLTKKCFDAIAAVTETTGTPTQSAAGCIADPTTLSNHFSATPWKPPRRAA